MPLIRKATPEDTARIGAIARAAYAKYVPRIGRELMDHAVGEAKRRCLSAIRLYTNAAMTENLSIYAHMGFVETHRAIEKGFNRVYMRWTLPGGEE
jgi:ribosomal protein S18 acetylase RimI-like enzyme